MNINWFNCAVWGALAIIAIVFWSIIIANGLFLYAVVAILVALWLIIKINKEKK